MTWDQIGIIFTGVVAVFLSQDRRQSWRRFACFFGLAAQPFWLATAWIHEQWGIFAMSFLYGASWALGLWNNWIKKS